jgi:hypothetical protein
MYRKELLPVRLVAWGSVWNSSSTDCGFLFPRLKTLTVLFENKVDSEDESGEIEVKVLFAVT